MSSSFLFLTICWYFTDIFIACGDYKTGSFDLTSFTSRLQQKMKSFYSLRLFIITGQSRTTLIGPSSDKAEICGQILHNTLTLNGFMLQPADGVFCTKLPPRSAPAN